MFSTEIETSPLSEHVVDVSGPPGSLLYAIGDVHGRLDLLNPLIEKVREDAANYTLARKPILLFLGDYVDRGADSRGVIARLVELRSDPDFRLVALRGNHDQYLLDFLEAPGRAQSWMDYGGAATLISYGVAPALMRADPEAWEETRRELAAAMPIEHRHFLEATQLVARFGDFVFAHAGVRPGVALEEQTPADLMTIRRTFLKSERPLPDCIVVFGHTPFKNPTISKGRLALDTGAYATHVLTAAKIYGDRVSFLQAR